MLDKFKEKFAITDSTIFAYGDTIYVNGNLPDDLLIHEIEHLKQQEKDGLDYWIENYLNDPQYRLKQELGAYKAQLNSITDRNFRAKIYLESVKTLSSSLYGNLITFEEAKKLLK